VHLHASAAQIQKYCRAAVCEELAQDPYTVNLTRLEPVGLLFALQAERSNQSVTVM